MSQQPLVGPRPTNYLGFTITLRHTKLGWITLDEWSARHIDIYLTKHNNQKRHKSMLSAGFEPTIPASERQQTHALDRAANGICNAPLLDPKYTVTNMYAWTHITPVIKAKSHIFSLHTADLWWCYHLSYACTRRVRKVEIHHVQTDRQIFMFIVATLPSTLILYLWAVLVWQW